MFGETGTCRAGVCEAWIVICACASGSDRPFLSITSVRVLKVSTTMQPLVLPIGTRPLDADPHVPANSSPSPDLP